MTPQARHNARVRAGKRARGECLEFGCAEKAAPGRVRCHGCLAAAAARAARRREAERRSKR